MRFVLYNIRYGTGGHHRLPWRGYTAATHDQLEPLADFLTEQDPDIVGLIEVDAGSFRMKNANQAQILSERLGHYHIYKSKYDERFHNLPVLSKQGNALLVRDTIQNQKFHYFKRGLKKMVIELELPNLVVFLVHLALGVKARHKQLGDLYALIRDVQKPVIVAGDFNAIWGPQEIDLFLAATKLQNANVDHLPTFPSWEPKRHLDFILHSADIHITNFHMPQITLSDHLPLICDFDIPPN